MIGNQLHLTKPRQLSATTFSSNTSITIYLPLDSDDPYVTLEELVTDVKLQLENIEETEALPIIYKKLNRLKVKLPPQNQFKGLVALISQDMEEIIPLHFSVEKKICIGTAQDLTDLLSLNLKHEGQDLTPSEENLTRSSFAGPFGFQPFCKRTF